LDSDSILESGSKVYEKKANEEKLNGTVRNFSDYLSYMSKYVALLFNMIRINCTPQNVPGLSKLKRKKVSSKMCG
jgi:hypothetical protein